MKLWKVALIAFGVIIAVPLATTWWSWAGSLVSSPDSTAVFMGALMYAVLAAVIIVLLVAGSRKAKKALDSLNQ